MQKIGSMMEKVMSNGENHDSKEDDKDNVEEILRLKKELKLMSENYERLFGAYENYKVEVEDRIERYKDEAAEAKERLKEIVVEKEDLKKSYGVYRGEMEKMVGKSENELAENQEKLREAIAESKKLKERFKNWKIENKESKIEIER